MSPISRQEEKALKEEDPLNSDIQSQLVTTNAAPTNERVSIDPAEEAKRFGSNLSHPERLSETRPNNSTRLLKKANPSKMSDDNSINYQNLMNESKVNAKLPSPTNNYAGLAVKRIDDVSV